MTLMELYNFLKQYTSITLYLCKMCKYIYICKRKIKFKKLKDYKHIK